MSAKYEHLFQIAGRLDREKARYAADRNALRAVWVAQIEKELASELAFLGLASIEAAEDDLLAELFS